MNKEELIPNIETYVALQKEGVACTHKAKTWQTKDGIIIFPNEVGFEEALLSFLHRPKKLGFYDWG